MKMSQTDEVLLSYKVIELSLLPLLLPTQNKKYADIFLSLTNGTLHEAVELRGMADLFSALSFFLWLRRTVPEVCYRPESGELGTVIFSIHGSGEKLRPVWVEEALELSQEEKEQVEGLVKDISFSEGVIDVIPVWEKVKEHCPTVSERALIELFDVLIGDKKAVSLEGIIPLLPAFLVVNYLVALRKTVVWNGMTLQ